MRTRVFLTVVLAATVAWTGLAFAKGPTAATVTGAGLDQPLAISGGEGSDTDFWTLAEQAGFFAAAFGQQPDVTLDAAPTTVLGEKLVISWQVPTDGTNSDVIVQDIYPLADGGPLAYMAPGQPLFGQPTQGGWFRAAVEITATLERLGVPPLAAATQVTAPAVQVTVPAVHVTVPAAAAEQQGSTRQLSSLALPMAGVLVLLAGLAFGGRTVRRRARMATG